MCRPNLYLFLFLVNTDHQKLKIPLDKLVPLPSIFFIGKNGAPLEIVTGVTNTVAELETKINGVLTKVNSNPSTSSGNASSNLIASKFMHIMYVVCIWIINYETRSQLIWSFLDEKQQVESREELETVCENGVCYQRPKQANSSTTSESVENKTAEIETTSNSGASSDQANEEKLQRAKDILAKKRKDKEEEDARVCSFMFMFMFLIYIIEFLWLFIIYNL